MIIFDQIRLPIGRQTCVRKFSNRNNKYLIINRFPGLTADDMIIPMIKLLNSKNPNLQIAISGALEKYSTVCNKEDFIEQFRNKNNYLCDDGFTLDKKTLKCYFVLQYMNNGDSINSIDCPMMGAQSLTFNNDNDLEGFLGLLQEGLYISMLILAKRLQG